MLKNITAASPRTDHPLQASEPAEWSGGRAFEGTCVCACLPACVRALRGLLNVCSGIWVSAGSDDRIACRLEPGVTQTQSGLVHQRCDDGTEPYGRRRIRSPSKPPLTAHPTCLFRKLTSPRDPVMEIHGGYSELARSGISVLHRRCLSIQAQRQMIKFRCMAYRRALVKSIRALPSLCHTAIRSLHLTALTCFESGFGPSASFRGRWRYLVPPRVRGTWSLTARAAW